MHFSCLMIITPKFYVSSKLIDEFCLLNDNFQPYFYFFYTVPSQIIDDLSSDDVVVQEGETVVLVCNVTGVPHPEVTWYRRKVSSKNVDKESTCGNMNGLFH